MTLLRRLAYLALALVFAQIVFGAIVRISGSGLGCGEHWPTCNGSFFPPLNRPDLIIEITHRYIAATVTVAILALVGCAYVRRGAPGASGPGGVLRAATLATALVLVAAVFGAITVKLSLNPYVIVTHLAIAMTLLAVLSSAVLRAGGWGMRGAPAASGRTARAAAAAAALAFLTIVFGALTANIPGANVSCGGFPWCRTILLHGTPLNIQITHRVLAFLLFFHTLGTAVAQRRRNESALVKRAAWLGFGVVTVQLVVAAVLVESHLPPAWRSLHQAMGTLVWLTLFTVAAVTRAAAPDRVLGDAAPTDVPAWT